MTDDRHDMRTPKGATDLDALFDQARAQPPEVPDALMARVLADAGAVQPARSLWVRLFEAIGGLAGVGGLVTATGVGIWLGVAPPETMPDLAGLVLGIEVEGVDAYDAIGATGFGWDIGES